VATEHVAAAGLLDMLSSDYVPSSLLQTAFALPHAVPAIGLAEAIALVTRAPARAVGLSDRGAIVEGLRGDVVRVATPGGLPAVRAVWREGVRVL
jgi:alpha-D-ribose 1-methylphosphonate 5-triphosphate diphosphatase